MFIWFCAEFINISHNESNLDYRFVLCAVVIRYRIRLYVSIIYVSDRECVVRIDLCFTGHNSTWSLVVG